MTRQGAEVMDEIEKRARELLAAEYEKEGILGAVDPIMFAVDCAAVAAIATALRSAHVSEEPRTAKGKTNE